MATRAEGLEEEAISIVKMESTRTTQSRTRTPPLSPALSPLVGERELDSTLDCSTTGGDTFNHEEMIASARLAVCDLPADERD
jgi:hypothetical protein